MSQSLMLAPDAVAVPAGTLPWITRREARLRPEHAGLYPGIGAGAWEPAAVLVDRIVAARLLRGGHLEIRGRMLSDEHFEFRGGSEAVASRPRREDR